MSTGTDLRNNTFSPDLLFNTLHTFHFRRYECSAQELGSIHLRKLSTAAPVWLAGYLTPKNPERLLIAHPSSPLGVFLPTDVLMATVPLMDKCKWTMIEHLGSDHLPIQIEFSLAQVPFPKTCPPVFNFRKAKWDACQQHISSHAPTPESLSTMSVHKVVFVFTILLLDVA